MRKKTLIAFSVIFVGLLLFVYFYEIKGAKKREEKKEQAKKIFILKKDEIKRVKLKNREGEVLFKKVDDKWKIEEPIASETDSEKVDDLLDKLVDLEMKRIVDESPSDLSIYSLEEPLVKVTFAIDKDGGREESFFLGDETPVGSGRYLMKEGEKRVIVTDTFGLDIFDKGLFDFRKKEVFDFTRDKVRGIEIYSGDKLVWSAKKEDGKWSVPISSSKVRGDRDAIEDIIDDLLDIKAKEFIEGSTPDASGLSSPLALITVIFTDNSSQTLLIGSKAGDEFYVKRKEGAETVKVDAEKISGILEKKPEDLRASKLLPLDRWEVQKVSIRDDKDYSFLKEKGDWFRIYSKDKKEEVSWTKMDNLLSTLFDLKIEEYIPVSSIDRYGLDKPEYILNVEAEKESVSIKIGKAKDNDKESYFSLLENEDFIYRINGEKVKKIQEDLLELEKREEEDSIEETDEEGVE